MKRRWLFYVKIAIALAFIEGLAQVVWQDDGAMHVDLYHGDEILAVSTTTSTVFYDRDLNRIGRRTLCVTPWNIFPASSPNSRYFVSRDGVVYDEHLASAGRYENHCMRIVIAPGPNDSRDKLLCLYLNKYICFDLGSQADITEQVPFLTEHLKAFRPNNIPAVARRAFLYDNGLQVEGTRSLASSSPKQLYQDGKMHFLKDSDERKAKIIDGKVYYAHRDCRGLLVQSSEKVEKLLEIDGLFSDWDISRSGDIYLAREGRVEKYVVSDGAYKLEKAWSCRSVIGVLGSSGLFRMCSQVVASVFRREFVRGSNLIETGLQPGMHLLQ